MMKRLEIDGRTVTVYPKNVEINGEEVVTQGEILIELLPEVWAPIEGETATSASVQEMVTQQSEAIDGPTSG
ncbi:hypothetical protein ACFQ1T_07280 [Methylophilus glucosoxydans]|uniref:Uncharacterized protein n=1 Tax=Methylophilus glucosoxydans TaxID=752553 RepID=A0ABW3GLQ3_9PROT|nr:hypothetical protein [Methylophilus sp. 13]MBF5039257.1 hypothetical protein [Methylophilus sp. 13]